MAQRDSRSLSLSQFVLKVHSRCDLSCDHCYVYEHADQSWRRQPRTMSAATVRAVAGRIAEHAAAHRLRRVRVVLHGGEPLLLGREGLRSTLAELTAVIAPVAALELRMQSNGVRLTEEICDILAGYRVRVGISLDGDRESNDRHRVFAGGRGSYGHVVRALRLLRRPEYRDIYAGILCTVDVRNDPIQVYEAIAEQEPPQVDFLLPHATWDQPPPRPAPAGAVYADWLRSVHERWVADGRPFGIRLFDSLRAAGAGGRSTSEWVGLTPADLVVVETDGSWEQADSLKTAYDGAPATGLDVFAHTVDEVASVPGVARRQLGLDGLCQTCRSCSVVRQCGGGLFAHRYRTGTGFDNPSVFCEDLKNLAIYLNEIPVRPSPPNVRRRPEPARPDTVPRPVFDQLASGCGDAGAVRYLATRWLSDTSAILAGIAGRFADREPVSEAWRVLTELSHTAREAVGWVLAHPYVRPWAARAVRSSTSDVDPSFLSGLAAAAAVLAGADARLAVPARAGAVQLPAVGTFRVPDGVGTALVSVAASGFTARWDGGGVEVPDRSRPGGGWFPARRIALGADGGFLVGIEDEDPHRDCHDWPVGGRLSDAEHGAWVAALRDAWRRIREDAPGYEHGLRAGLRLVTPFAPAPAGTDHSSTARHAFGAVGAALAPGPDLAVMLVHEFQHSKLNALLDRCELVDGAQRSRLLRVGWRADPRPVEGVLHGVYAHAAVADIWRSRASRDPGDPVARRHFLRYRDWTATAIDDLFATGALTPAGSAFAGRLADTVATWQT